MRKEQDPENSTELEQAIAQLEAIGEQMHKEHLAQMTYREQAFLSVIPKDAKTLYIHQSHRLNSNLATKLEQTYGKQNIIKTNAPAHSGQSFTTYYTEIEQEKANRLTTPLNEFLKEKSIDAILYLCSSVCDGYQSPIFPEDVETHYHIWHAIRTAQQHQKPLIVGYQDTFCFRARCPEREYITDQERIKIPISTINI